MSKTKQSRDRDRADFMQCAALPVRLSSSGLVQVMLLTSRDTRRWVIPKGWPIRKLSAPQTAAREAFEEAGLEGAIADTAPIGRYTYQKQLACGSRRPVVVDVFLMLVSRQLEYWPEQGERETRWIDVEDAHAMVAEPELARIIQNLDRTILTYMTTADGLAH